MKIPDGWKLESLPGSEQLLLSTPPPSYMVTIDFERRGFRVGLVQHGRFADEKVTRAGSTRKEYSGRGWKQELVDDAVAWLRKIVEKRP